MVCRLSWGRDYKHPGESFSSGSSAVPNTAARRVCVIPLWLDSSSDLVTGCKWALSGWLWEAFSLVRFLVWRFLFPPPLFFDKSFKNGLKSRVAAALPGREVHWLHNLWFIRWSHLIWYTLTAGQIKYKPIKAWPQVHQLPLGRRFSIWGGLFWNLGLKHLKCARLSQKWSVSFGWWTFKKDFGW